MNQLLLLVLFPVALAQYFPGYLRPNAPHIVPRKDINGQEHPVIVDQQLNHKNVRVINANDPIAQSILRALDRIPAQQEIIERNERRSIVVFKDKAQQLKEKRSIIILKDKAQQLKKRAIIVFKDPTPEQVQQTLRQKRARYVIVF